MNNITAERFNVAGAMLAKLFGRPDRERDLFASRAGSVRDVGITTAIYSRILLVALGLVTALGTAIVYWIGGNLAVSGTITAGTLAAFAAYVALIYQPLAQLTNSRVDVLTALVSFERVFEVLDFPAAIADRPGAVDLVDPRGRIELDHVWFRHPAGHEVSLESLEAPGTPGGDEPSDWTLRDVSLVVEPGDTIALVGASGAGKTTIAMLVPRVADTVEGSVQIDGHDVRDLTLESLHAAIGLVPQDPHLFHDTIRANLRFARPDATDDDLLRALERARICRPRALIARRSRHRRRRARLPHVGRREAASRDRTSALEEPRDRDPRRSDVAPRFRIGAGDPARVRRSVARPHRDRDRAPTLDHRRRGPDRRRRRGSHRRDRYPQRALGAGRDVRRAVPHATGPIRERREVRVADSRGATTTIGADQ